MTKTPWFHIVCELDAQAKPAPTIRDIQRAVCRRFPAVTVNDIISELRFAELIMPRHIAMYLASKLTLKGARTIGDAFGYRDHSTCAYGIRKIEKLAQEDTCLQAMLASITTELGCAA